MPQREPQRGMSLIELLLVLSIGAIVSATALGAFARARDHARGLGAARAIALRVAGVRLTRCAGVPRPVCSFVRSTGRRWCRRSSTEWQRPRSDEIADGTDERLGPPFRLRRRFSGCRLRGGACRAADRWGRLGPWARRRPRPDRTVHFIAFGRLGQRIVGHPLSRRAGRPPVRGSCVRTDRPRARPRVPARDWPMGHAMTTTPPIERRAARRWLPQDLPWPIGCRVTPGHDVLVLNLSAVGILHRNRRLALSRPSADRASDTPVAARGARRAGRAQLRQRDRPARRAELSGGDCVQSLVRAAMGTRFPGRGLTDLAPGVRIGTK